MMNTRMRGGLGFVALAFLLAAGCARGADEGRLQEDLQEKLNRDLKPGLFEVVALRRQGSAPLSAGANGARRVVVYFNTTLKLVEDYGLGGWDQLGPSSITFALGATDKGIFGLKAEGRAGDLVRAYGSAVYEQTGDGWIPGTMDPAAAAKTAPTTETEPPSRSKQLIDSLAALVDLPPPGVPPQQDEIIAEELARASENIERRVKRRDHTFTVATGPEGGEYARFGSALIAAVNAIAPNVKLRGRPSEGSVENAWLLSRGEVDYAIVQGDVAAAAVAGADLFARGGPLATLRAVGGLFPEAIHVVVRKDSPLRDVGQLRGRRVAIGTVSSGTRFDAVAVLAGHGIKVSELGEACEDGPADALARLERGELDAVFVTGAAPVRTLQQFALTPGLRLLSMDDAALGRVIEARPGLSRLILPANTYPEQRQPVVTAAAAALLLTTADAPVTEVERVTDLVFMRLPQQPRASADAVRVSAAGQLRGVTIPLHPGAARQGSQ
jgi:TRAP transporter TAXI family solute receptor